MPSQMKGPYRGLVPFDEEDYAYFCGRSRERKLIAANMKSARLTLLIGPSGVGKSSLLRAGVAHDLTEAAKANFATRKRLGFVPVIVRKWALDPIAEIARKTAERMAEMAVDLPAAHGGPLSKLLNGWQESGQGDLLLALDQFEEFFLYHASCSDQAWFSRVLADLFYRYPEVRLLLSMREDRVCLLESFRRDVPGLFENIMRVDHLDERAAAEAVHQPLAQWNSERGTDYRAEPELVKEIMRQLHPEQLGFQETGLGLGKAVNGNQGAERIQAPYLQLVLSRIWDTETQAGSQVLRADTLKKLKGVREIARQHLADQMRPFHWPQKQAAARMFQWLVTPSGAKVLYPAADLVRKAGSYRLWAGKVLEQLSGEGRILSSINVGGRVAYEIYHDQLGPAMLVWRRRFLWRTAAGYVGIWAVLVMAAIGFSFTRTRHAEALAGDYRVLSAALAAADQRPADANVYQNLALLAWERRQSASQLERVRLDQFLRQAFPLREESLGFAKLYGVAFSPNGNFVAYSGAEPRVGVFDRNAMRLRYLHGTSPAHIAVVFSPLSEHLACAGSDGVVTIWKTADLDQAPVVLRNPARAGAALNRIAYNEANDDLMAVAGADGAITVWDPKNARLLASWEASAKPVNSVAFRPDGRMLASAAGDGSVKLWSVPGWTPAGELSGHEAPVVALSFSPDGRRLASSDGAGTVRVWDLATKSDSTVLPQGSGVFGLAYNHDGKSLAVGTFSGVLRVLDTATWKPTGQVQTRRVNWLAFSSGGTRIAVAGDDGVMRMWNQRLQPILSVPPPDAVSGKLAGGRIVTGGADGTIGLWDAFGSQTASFLTIGARVRDAVCSPSGQFAALTLANGKREVWDIRGGKPVSGIELPAGPVSLTDDGWVGYRDAPDRLVVANIFIRGSKTISVPEFTAFALARGGAAADASRGPHVLIVLGHEKSVEVLRYLYGTNTTEPAGINIALPEAVTAVYADANGASVVALRKAGGVLLRWNRGAVAFDLPGADHANFAADGSAVVVGAGRILVVRPDGTSGLSTSGPVIDANLLPDGSGIVTTLPGNRWQVFATRAAAALNAARRKAQSLKPLTEEQCRQYLNGPCPGVGQNQL